MSTVDLHGVLHEEVERVLHGAFLTLDIPLCVITGHSFRMKSLVAAVASGYGYYVYPALGNTGRLIIDKERSI